MRVTAAGVTRLFMGGRSANASAAGCVCESEGVVCHFPFKGGRRAAWRRLGEGAVRELLDSRELVATHDATHPLGLYALGKAAA